MHGFLSIVCRLKCGLHESMYECIEVVDRLKSDKVWLLFFCFSIEVHSLNSVSFTVLEIDVVFEPACTHRHTHMHVAIAKWLTKMDVCDR